MQPMTESAKLKRGCGLEVFNVVPYEQFSFFLSTSPYVQISFAILLIYILN